MGTSSSEPSPDATGRRPIALRMTADRRPGVEDGEDSEESKEEHKASDAAELLKVNGCSQACPPGLPEGSGQGLSRAPIRRILLFMSTSTDQHEWTPRSDDRPLWDIALGVLVSKALLLAHSLKLFSLLSEGRRTAAEIGEQRQLAARPVAALMSILSANGLVDCQDGRYGLTQLSEDYLLESSPGYLGSYLDAFASDESITSLAVMREAVLTDGASHAGGQVYTLFQQDHGLARQFTRAMHGYSVVAALGWPKCIDLSAHEIMLDIAGGSGAHAVSATRRWPKLKAVVLDLAPVCAVADELIAEAQMHERITTRASDMWTDPFPSGDVHFYAEVFHNWPPEKGRFLAQKSFDSLPAGGRIILHEMLFNEDKTGPGTVAAFNLGMLMWQDGQQYSGRELTELLAGVGFVDTEVKLSLGYWAVVTGRKR